MSRVWVTIAKKWRITRPHDGTQKDSPGKITGVPWLQATRRRGSRGEGKR